MNALQSRRILDVRVDATSYQDAVSRIVGWAAEDGSRAVYVATVNNVMEARRDPSYRELMNSADLVTPDGMPLVWGLRQLGIPAASRVYGPDLTPAVCEAAARSGTPVGFYGGSPDVLERLVAGLRSRYPSLPIAYAYSPPFRHLSADEDRAVLDAITRSGAKILFVGLGAPKQERWIAERRDRLSTVMIGVGAAFDFLAEAKRQAPPGMQKAGLEWLFRLATEPRRLWKRYLRQNPAFMALFAAQLRRERASVQRTRSPQLRGK